MHYFIEMGQGFIKYSKFQLSTSTLYSCCLLVALNKHRNCAGAFHYPAKGLERKSLVNDLKCWLTELQPTRLIIVLARDVIGNGKQGTSLRDKTELRSLCHTVTGLSQITLIKGTSVAMEFDGSDGIVAGDQKAKKLYFDKKQMIDLSNWSSGKHDKYGGFFLCGKNQSNDA